MTRGSFKPSLLLVVCMAEVAVHDESNFDSDIVIVLTTVEMQLKPRLAFRHVIHSLIIVHPF